MRNCRCARSAHNAAFLRNDGYGGMSSGTQVALCSRKTPAKAGLRVRGHPARAGGSLSLVCVPTRNNPALLLTWDEEDFRGRVTLHTGPGDVTSGGNENPVIPTELQTPLSPRSGGRGVTKQLTLAYESAEILFR